MSLLPSATEIVCAVGSEASIVGRSHHCDWPGSIGALPCVTAPRATGGAAVDAGLLRSLAPDLVLAQDPRDVPPGDWSVLALDPASVWDVLDDILRVGEAVGRAREAESVMVTLRERWWSAVDFVNPYEPGDEVLVLEWMDPPIVAGRWTPQLVAAAGGRHALNATGSPSRRVSPEEILEAAPTRVIVAPCGMSLAESRRRIGELTRQPWWPLVPAVLDGPGRVALVDGRRSFSRPGPGLVDAFEWLAGWLNHRPDIAPTGFLAEIL